MVLSHESNHKGPWLPLDFLRFCHLMLSLIIILFCGNISLSSIKKQTSDYWLILFISLLLLLLLLLLLFIFLPIYFYLGKTNIRLEGCQIQPYLAGGFGCTVKVWLPILTLPLVYAIRHARKIQKHSSFPVY